MIKTSMIFKALIALSFAMIATQAQAAILEIDPMGFSCNGSDDCWMGDLPKNPKADDIEGIVNPGVELLCLYKNDVGLGNTEGLYQPFYNTEYFNTPADPKDATITFTGLPGESILPADTYLLVKGGNSFARWYIFDLENLGWDGTNIELTNFWPTKGAISHVGIVGPGSAPIPEPSTILILGAGLCCIAGTRGLKKKK